MCVYHNDTKLLQELLNTFPYPRTSEGEVSPLSYAFRNNYLSSVKLLCENLAQNEHRVDLTKRDFEYLLHSPYGYSHKLMATIPKQTDMEVFPSFVQMNGRVKLFNVNNVNECLLKIHQMHSSTRNDSYINNNKKTKDRKDVAIYEIPFKYSFAAGSLGSVNFLFNYSESNNEDFLLSQWKNVVIVKWKHQLPLQIFIAVVYWAFTLSVMTSMVFARERQEVKYTSIALTLVLFIVEILQCVSYCSFKVSA
jgi:hypothetical protein